MTTNKIPVGVAMRPAFLQFVHAKITAGEKVADCFTSVPCVAVPTLTVNFKVFYDHEEFFRAIRLRMRAGDSIVTINPSQPDAHALN